MAWNPFWDINRELEDMRRRLEAFGGFGEMGGERGRGLTPQVGVGTSGVYVDVVEEENRYVVTADLPGVNKEDIHVRIEDSDLVIEAESKREEEREEQGYLRRERSRRSFRRRIPLPGAVKEQEARSTFRNGVLEIRLPKEDHVGKGHEIQIE